MKGTLFSIITVLSLLSFTAGANQVKRYDFKVFLDEKEIGRHHFVVSPGVMRTHVSSEARFDVKFLFITVYTYVHDNREVWEGNCLRAIQATTNDNGASLFVRGEYRDRRLVVETPAGRREMDGCLRSFAYWDPGVLESEQLLNAQTGELMPVDIVSLGQDVIDVRGIPTPAARYRINNEKGDIDLWYSGNKEWLALESTTEGGARLRYQVQ